MRKHAANILSILFTPLLAPAYLFAIIMFSFPQLTEFQSLSQKLIILVCMVWLTFLLPFLLVLILYSLKIISTVTLDDKKDRLIPQIFSCINYILISYFLVYRFGPGSALFLAMAAVTISVVIITFITPYWKISTHAAGISGILSIATFLFILYPSTTFLWIYILIIMATITVCAARLYLKVHTPLQIAAGCLLGSLVGSLIYLVK